MMYTISDGLAKTYFSMARLKTFQRGVPSTRTHRKIFAELSFDVCKLVTDKIINVWTRGGARHFHLGGPLEGPVLQQGGCQWSV